MGVPDRPGDPPDTNAYFSRPFCVQELRWAREAGVPIQPVIRTMDKQRIGDLIAAAPDDLKDLRSTDFITLDRSDPDYWKIGIDKIIKAAAGMIGAGKISNAYPLSPEFDGAEQQQDADKPCEYDNSLPELLSTHL